MNLLGWWLITAAAVILQCSTDWFRHGAVAWVDPVLLLTTAAARQAGGITGGAVGLLGGLMAGAAAGQPVEVGILYGAVGFLVGSDLRPIYCVLVALVVSGLQAAGAGVDPSWWVLACNNSAVVYLLARTVHRRSEG